MSWRPGSLSWMTAAGMARLLTIASLVGLPVAWFHYPVALLPVAISAAPRADQTARPATQAALVAAVIAARPAIVTSVMVWRAVAFLLLAVHVSRPRTV
jgi:hypothetical protein